MVSEICPIIGVVAGFADHFSGHAAQYAAYRPAYPAELGAYLAGLCASWSAAWDCATGNGQAALILADHFDHLVATDGSREQISHARAHPHVRYALALATAPPLIDRSVDLVTVAQALHWFDLPAFYAEVDRVLRPNGVFAAWCYGLVEVDPQIDPILRWFYGERVGSHWPFERIHVDAGYADLPFPYPEREAGRWSMNADLTLRQLLDYIGTWSAVVKARQAEGRDPRLELEAALARVWTADDGVRPVSWPISLRVGRAGRG